MPFISIDESYLIVDRVGDTYGGELGRVFKPPVSIHKTRYCLMDCPVQWDFKVEILGVILCLVQNCGWHEALSIRPGKDK